LLKQKTNNTSLSLIPVPLMLIQKLALKQGNVYEIRVKARENWRKKMRQGRDLSVA
jgi:hypothetical protein